MDLQAYACLRILIATLDAGANLYGSVAVCCSLNRELSYSGNIWSKHNEHPAYLEQECSALFREPPINQ